MSHTDDAAQLWEAAAELADEYTRGETRFPDTPTGADEFVDGEAARFAGYLRLRIQEETERLHAEEQERIWASEDNAPLTPAELEAFDAGAQDFPCSVPECEEDAVGTVDGRPYCDRHSGAEWWPAEAKTA